MYQADLGEIVNDMLSEQLEIILNQKLSADIKDFLKMIFLQHLSEEKIDSQAMELYLAVDVLKQTAAEDKNFFNDNTAKL